MSEKNHFSGIQWLSKVFKVERIHHLSRKHVPTIAWLFGEQSTSMANRYIEIRMSSAMPYANFYGHCVSRPFFIRLRCPQVCVRCIEEEQFTKKWWDVNLATACFRHKLFLIETCQRCKKNLNWNRPGIAICQCGFDLRESCVIASTTEAEMVSEWIAGKVENIYYDKINSDYAPLKIFRRLSLDGMLRIIFATGFRENKEHQLRAGKAKKILSVDEASACVERSLHRLKLSEMTNNLPMIRKEFLISGLELLVNEFQHINDARLAMSLLDICRNRNSHQASFTNFNPRSQLQLF
ncbi:hypothetical protein ACO0KY_17770 [Undibacterium sp. Dicai25W]|uniref:hypothetical protein n=1 Tax=Undibacterium sp. Dicai25W TaxID=3413034 RepID=UPI003BF36ECE